MTVPLSLTATYGAVHEVLLNAAASRAESPSDLRLLLVIAERGGRIEGPSDKLVASVGWGSNSTALRRSALALAAGGLVTSASQRGVGMRLALTDYGRALADNMLNAIRDALADDALSSLRAAREPEAVAA